MTSSWHSSAARLALIVAVFACVPDVASAADAPMPVVCGANGCTSLTTATLQGLLTLPEALRPAEPPPAEPYFLFRVQLDGVFHQVVYIPHETDALLWFVGEPTWRRVPVDDARLLADAARGRTPYPARDGAPLGEQFAASVEHGPKRRTWLALAALLGLGAAGVATVAASRR